MTFSLGKHRLNVALVADVCLDRDRLAAKRLDLMGHVVRCLWVNDVVDDDISARSRESKGHCAPDSRVCPRHYRRLSFQHDGKANGP